MLKVEHITTGYGKKRVLSDVSFEVGEREVVLLSGGNGSGKSTVLKTIYGLLRPWKVGGAAGSTDVFLYPKTICGRTARHTDGFANTQNTSVLPLCGRTDDTQMVSRIRKTHLCSPQWTHRRHTDGFADTQNTSVLPLEVGRVLLDGEDITALPTEALIRRGIVYMPQKRNVFDDFTVEENLLTSASIYPKGEARRRAERVFDELPRLAELRRRTPFNLSGGERQLLAFGNVG